MKTLKQTIINNAESNIDNMFTVYNKFILEDKFKEAALLLTTILKAQKTKEKIEKASTIYLEN